ncbi:hypothetical protein E2562_026327 [Oryza meyeriana var. granulata]|uniref:Uncharacterized protein n=1 Tax=Oryza meyeriana var. granulata TaxID=110450 RepID=A0A6G1D7X6_9ORYZ|nr:hypothetical protein E2562_026327 [Oryza meyeriana var. granulata]
MEASPFHAPAAEVGAVPSPNSIHSRRRDDRADQTPAPTPAGGTCAVTSPESRRPQQSSSVTTRLLWAMRTTLTTVTKEYGYEAMLPTELRQVSARVEHYSNED